MNAQTITSASTSTTNTSAPQIIYLNQQQSNDHHTLNNNGNHIHHSHHQQQHNPHLHQLIQPQIEIIETKAGDGINASYQQHMSQMQSIPDTSDMTQSKQQQQFIYQSNSHHSNETTTTIMNSTIAVAPSTLLDQNQNVSPNGERRSDEDLNQQQLQLDHYDDSVDQQSPATRFKWTNEKTQVAMNLVKYGCKPKLVSVAVGCSLRTAQKFAETVTPKIEGESFKTYEIKRRGRKSKDVNQRLNAIREVLSKDFNKTQVEIAADLKVSNTTVCRDLKRIGASWKEKKYNSSACNTSSGSINANNTNNTSIIDLDEGHHQTTATISSSQRHQQQHTTRKTRQSNVRAGQNSNNTNNDSSELTSLKTRRRARRSNSTQKIENDLAGQDHQSTATSLNHHQ